VLLDRVRGRAEGLFGVSVEDVRLALRAQGTDAGYRDLVRDWFGRFVGRALQSIVDREVSNVVGGPALASPAAAEALHSELLAFAHERTRILHEFAPAWLSKAVWAGGRAHTQDLPKILWECPREGAAGYQPRAAGRMSRVMVTCGGARQPARRQK
jgi:hypothetical protein